MNNNKFFIIKKVEFDSVLQIWARWNNCERFMSRFDWAIAFDSREDAQRVIDSFDGFVTSACGTAIVQFSE